MNVGVVADIRSEQRLFVANENVASSLYVSHPSSIAICSYSVFTPFSSKWGKRLIFVSCYTKCSILIKTVELRYRVLAFIAKFKRFPTLQNDKYQVF